MDDQDEVGEAKPVDTELRDTLVDLMRQQLVMQNSAESGRYQKLFEEAALVGPEAETILREAVFDVAINPHFLAALFKHKLDAILQVEAEQVADQPESIDGQDVIIVAPKREE